MLGLVGSIALTNNVHAKDLIENLWDKSCRINRKEIQQEIKDTLSKKQMYEIQRNELFKDIEHNENAFKKLIDSNIQQINKENTKDPDVQKLLFYMYCDCEFANIDAPKKLRDLLSESKPRIAENNK